MGTNNLFGFGLRYLLDAHQTYTQSGTPVFLRVEGFMDENPDGSIPDYIQVGVPYAITGSDQVGVYDIQIVPQPAVQDVTLENIGYFGGRLNFGSRIFHISHTWVLQQMRMLEITDPYEVFRSRDGHDAVGLMNENRMFAIEAITHVAAGGEIVKWKIVGNAQEAQEVR